METGFEFHPAVWAWFQRAFGTPTLPQLQGWPAIQSGRHTLIAAPTGSGKTLAAFLAALDRLFRSAAQGEQRNQTEVLYVSPLKALSNDIHKNLEIPLSGIQEELRRAGAGDVAVRAAVRTGDTPASERLSIGRNPPHILVTTPESLYLLLTSESGRRTLRTVRTVIVDEIHALAANRRGTHLALSLERLAALTDGTLQRIGLSATQKPIEDVARFLVGSSGLLPGEQPDCAIVDAGRRREVDLEIEIPKSPLSAVMSNEVWEEVYVRLGELIESHRTTLVFVNTRRLAERVTHHLTGRLGVDRVMSHHGSLSAALRLQAEGRLKRGELKALVATASLELGIDIGSVDLVCQLGSTRAISTLLQRVGRAEHKRGGLPKGRLFPLTRDELLECAALIRSVRGGDLDRIEIPSKPLDILAQQLVACVASEEWREHDLYSLVRSAFMYRDLTRQEFESVLEMLADGFSTRRGRRGALIHRDRVHGRVRGRRGARMIALTSGGAIADNADYRVLLQPSETFVGTVNEDFAVESMAGDVFQLGNASWRVLQVASGVVRVEDAQGQPPNIPFWLGEAPARTEELSRAVSELRRGMEECLATGGDVQAWLMDQCAAVKDLANKGSESPRCGLSSRAALQLAEYYRQAWNVLGAIPTQRRLILERFFDESGGMQLVLHSAFGSRVNRAWGLALRKRFCRKFNFELQAAATDDAIVLSLGTQHSFPLEEVFRYLQSNSVRDLLVQALLDAPMFTVRWRWNVTRALAVPRFRGGRKLAAPLQRMEAENLLAGVFPDQLACLEHIAGDREIPDHPLVAQTIADCLDEAMDVSGLISVLAAIERGEIECLARDLPEPSPLAHEILNAKPYAFLDNAPLEERRTQAVYTRRVLESGADAALGSLDPAAIRRVCDEAWPRVETEDELHDLLLTAGVLDPSTWGPQGSVEPPPIALFESLLAQSRAARLNLPTVFWVAAERIPMLRVIYSEATFQPEPLLPETIAGKLWERSEAVRELVRGRMELSGPITAGALSRSLGLPGHDLEVALLGLEQEGTVLRGRFIPGEPELQWCERALLARIHRLTLNRLRAEIQPVSISEFHRFLAQWQRLGEENRAEGVEGLELVLGQLDGFELAAGAWEPEILSARVNGYDPRWLDRLCSAGRTAWGRLRARTWPGGISAAPVRSTPIAIYAREHLMEWLVLSERELSGELPHDTARVFDALRQGGALFFSELVARTRLLPSIAEQALAELVAMGLAASDSFEGIRALLVPAHKRARIDGTITVRRRKAVTSVEFAGRWSLLAPPGENRKESATQCDLRERAVEAFARILLLRYGVVFRRLMERESLDATWYEVGRIYRRLEARGEIRGGRFVSGVSGEQFAVPEAIAMLRAVRKSQGKGELTAISATDPLNLVGILTPGRRIAATMNNRILLMDGVPVAALESGDVLRLDERADISEAMVDRALKVGHLPPALRPYY